MSLRERFAMVFLLAGTIGGIYAVTSTGTPTTDPDRVARLCGLPSLGPAAVYTALGVPLPTLADGTGSGDCLPPADYEDALRKGRVAAAILPRWRSAGLTSTQCAAGVVEVNFGLGDAGPDEKLIQVCGPAPSSGATAAIEKLDQLPGTEVRLILGSIIGPYARNGEPVIRWWDEGSFPAAADALWACACRPDADVAGACLERLPSGAMGPARFATELGAGSWSGAACKRKPCGEALEALGRRPKNYSMPPECTVPPDPAPYVPPAPDGGLP